MVIGRGNRKMGKWGEDQACAFLRRRGFFIETRNYYTAVGEIDIVAKKDNDFYFVEVKTRRKGELATDLAVTAFKKIKLKKTIKKYCYEYNIGESGIVLSVLLVVYDPVLSMVAFRFTNFELG